MKSFIFYSIFVILAISVSGKEYGEVCGADDECTGPVGNPDVNLECGLGDGDRCRCKANYVKSENFALCLLIQDLLGGACQDSLQCQSGVPGQLSNCTSNLCTCSPGSGDDVNVCKLLVDERCERDDDGMHLCALNSECSSSKHCTCLDKHTPRSNLLGCLKYAEKVGEECEEHQQCQLGVPGNYSLCMETEVGFPIPYPKLDCQCIPDALSIHLNHKCWLKAARIGDECVYHEQCIANLINSRCVDIDDEKGCGCLEPNVAASNNLGCVPKRKLGESCTDPNQCNYIPHSASCREESGTCMCDPGYDKLNPSEEFCYKMASNVDEPCGEYPGQCRDLKEASCDNGLCKCNPGAVFIHGKCHHQSPLGGMCEFPEECMGGSNENAYCTSAKICACMPGTIQRDGKCYVQKKIGDSCVGDEECKVVILGGVYCDTNNQTCSCLEGYEPNPNGEACDGQSGLRAVGLLLVIGLLAVFSVN